MYRIVVAMAAALLLSACLSTSHVKHVIDEHRVQSITRHEGLERDRQAILAMVGEYHVTFAFDEVDPAPGYAVKDPKRSDAYELVLVAEDAGTRVDLNTASAMDVTYSEAERGIYLRTGEIVVTTAPDVVRPVRPLRVYLDQGVATALGTRYNIRRFNGYAWLAVFDGEVELTLRDGGQVSRIPAGICLEFDSRRVLRESIASENDIAWTRGLVIAERMPLGQFLETLQRYRHGLLQCDPAIAAHPLTGFFFLSDTDAVLDALQRGLPIRQQRLSRYWVRFLPA